MDTDVLRWFQQIAEGETVTDVAAIFQVSQPTVSRALDRLEAEVGTPLVRRAGRTLRLTRAGAALSRHVDAVLAHLDDGLAAVDQLIDPETGRVELSFQPSLGTWLVPDLVSTFLERHPRIRFALHQSRDESDPPLDDGEADLEITTRRRTGPGVRWHHLLDEPLRLAVPAAHRLAGHRGPISLAAVAGEPVIAVPADSTLHRIGQELWRRAGHDPDPTLVGEDLATVRGLIAAGLGVAVIPAPRPGRRDHPGSRVRHLQIDDPTAVRRIGLAWGADRRLLPAAELFRRHVIETDLGPYRVGGDQPGA